MPSFERRMVMTWIRRALTAVVVSGLLLSPAGADVKEVRLGVKGAT